MGATSYSRILSWYHDPRIETILYVQTQATQNRDSLACPVRPMTFRVLNLPCGWEFEEAGSVRAACPGLKVLQPCILGYQKEQKGMYRIYIRTQHADHLMAPEDEADVNGASTNTYELILCVDEYNKWFQNSGKGSCNNVPVDLNHGTIR